MKANKTTLTDAKRTAWAACDTFRGVIDASEYKDYILTFLFLKYISDVFDEHLTEAKRRYGRDAERIRRRMERERFVLPIGSSFDELYNNRHVDNIGELINIALDSVEEKNKAKLDGVFRNVDFNNDKLGSTRDRNRRLKHLIEDFANLDLSPSLVDEDVIGETYIYLIERFAAGAGKKAGEFYTPGQVANILAKLMQPRSGSQIYDPACGSGSLLIRTAAETGSKNFALFGQEANGGTWALARMNMFLHGLDGARIEWGDTLNDPKLVDGDCIMKFDIVVANPPFSLDKWGAEHASNDRYTRFWRGIPPKSKADWAFVTHMVESAKGHEGRIGVVVPHGVLFRGGAEGRIRRKLIEENLLDAVIGLPPNLFPTTAIPVAILLFDRGRESGGAHETRRDVMVIDASREYFAGKNQNLLLDDHVDRIIETYRNRTTVERYARPVSLEEIETNGFTLNVSRYVDTFPGHEIIDLKQIQGEIGRVERELAKLRLKMKTTLRDLGLNA